MGALLRVDCSSCGYGEEDFMLGGGMMVSVRPATCGSCRRIVAVVTQIHDGPLIDDDLPKGLNRCPHCRGQDLEDLPDTGDEPGAHWPCPRCESEVETVLAGLWD